MTPKPDQPSGSSSSDAAPYLGDTLSVPPAQTPGLPDRHSQPQRPSAAAHVQTPLSGNLAAMYRASKAQDLLADKLLLAAPRMEIEGQQVPSLGGIALLSKLGQGGMGAVYFGIHPRLCKEVAVKVLPFLLAESKPHLIERFVREAQIAAQITSPNLVPVLDVNQECGLFYLVMEFVRGKSAGELLDEVQRRGATGLEESVALDICIAAATGLAAAHAKGVVHRDIKPDNILLPMSDGGDELLAPAAKLADLGLARSDSGKALTESIDVMGTPGFMAPEQATDAKGVGKPADVFGLGATLFALLAGRPPFVGDTAMQVVLDTMKKPHPAITLLRPGVSILSAHLLEHCLAKDPKKRYADAAILLEALRVCRSALGKSRFEIQGDVEKLNALRLQPSAPSGVKPASSAIQPGMGMPSVFKKSVQPSPAGTPVAKAGGLGAKVGETLSPAPPPSPVVNSASVQQGSRTAVTAVVLFVAGFAAFVMLGLGLDYFAFRAKPGNAPARDNIQSAGAGIAGASKPGTAEAAEAGAAEKPVFTPRERPAKAGGDARAAPTRTDTLRKERFAQLVKDAQAALARDPDGALEKLRQAEELGQADPARRLEDLLEAQQPPLAVLKQQADAQRGRNMPAEIAAAIVAAREKARDPAKLPDAFALLNKTEAKYLPHPNADLTELRAALADLGKRLEDLDARKKQFDALVQEGQRLAAAAQPDQALEKFAQAEVLGKADAERHLPDLLAQQTPRLTSLRASALSQRNRQGRTGRPNPGGNDPAALKPEAARQGLETKQERDAAGRIYTRVLSRTEKADFGPGLRQIVCPPSGKELYAIYRDKPVVTIFDPLTLKQTDEIQTARNPVSIWADDRRIVVACDESRTVKFFDAATRAAVGSAGLNDDPAMQPQRILGPAPDGSVMTIWAGAGGKGGGNWDRPLVHVDEKRGAIRTQIKGGIDWGLYISNGARFFSQHGFRGSPSGVPEVFETATGKRENLHGNNLFGPNAGFHRNFAHCFMTEDRRHIVLPTRQMDGNGYQPWTYLATPDLGRIDVNFPGAAILEIPKEEIFVSWGFMVEDKKSGPPEIFYASRSNGRVLRRVSIAQFDPHPSEYLSVNADHTICFVPRHEYVLFLDPNDRTGARGATLVRCGPLPAGAEGAAGADHNFIVRNEPPASVKAGQALAFTPEFERPRNAKKVVYKLKSGPREIQVDADTGRVNWTPAKVAVGKYDVSIVALVDDTEVPLLTWVLEVEP